MAAERKDGKVDTASAFKTAMLANANRGGENVATGALIGAVLGASAGFAKLPKDLVAGLCPAKRAEIDAHIDAFIAASPLVAAGASR